MDKIIFVDDHITVHGSVPVQLKAYTDSDAPTETSKIEFKIEDDIPSSERFATYKKKSGGSPISMVEYEKVLSN